VHYGFVEMLETPSENAIPFFICWRRSYTELEEGLVRIVDFSLSMEGEGRII